MFHQSHTLSHQKELMMSREGRGERTKELSSERHSGRGGANIIYHTFASSSSSATAAAIYKPSNSIHSSWLVTPSVYSPSLSKGGMAAATARDVKKRKRRERERDWTQTMFPASGQRFSINYICRVPKTQLCHLFTYRTSGCVFKSRTSLLETWSGKEREGEKNDATSVFVIQHLHLYCSCPPSLRLSLSLWSPLFGKIGAMVYLRSTSKCSLPIPADGPSIESGGGRGAVTTH